MIWLLAITNILTLLAVWYAYRRGRIAGEVAGMEAYGKVLEDDHKRREDIRRMSDAELDERLRKYQRP